MNQPPDPNLNSSEVNEEPLTDDPALVNFLQRYQPAVPEPSPGLEDQILHAVLDEVTQSTAALPSGSQRQTSVEQDGWKVARWGIPAAIAATFILFWGGSQIWRMAKQPVPLDSDLEAFVAESWSGAFDPFNDVEADLLTDPLEWWGQQPPPAVIAEANTDMCKRSSPCHE